MVHKGKHNDLWSRNKLHIGKLDWYGNKQADEKAKGGAEKHGYTLAQKKIVTDNVYIAQRAQDHMIRTYKKYITNPLVRKDIESNAKIKGTREGKKGRPCIRPEQLGRDVKTSGQFEYCLGCGRSTKATHIE
eukprot:6253797-Heterocapsa_arctica.AAC.1